MDKIIGISAEVPFNSKIAISELSNLKDYKTEINRHTKQLDGRISYLEQFLLKDFASNDATKEGIVSGRLVAMVDEQEIGIVLDWDALHGWMIDNEDLGLLKKDAVSSRVIEAYKSAYDWDVVYVLANTDGDVASQTPKYRTIYFDKDTYYVCFSGGAVRNENVIGDIHWCSGLDENEPNTIIAHLIGMGVLPPPPPGIGIMKRRKIKLKSLGEK